MSASVQPCRVICVTPVRNEAWILDRFLSCAAPWADHIIVADQGSTDGSAEIARSHPKVTVVDSSGLAGYDEGGRQRMLLHAARQIPGRRLIVALDADEALSCDWRSSAQWAAAHTAPPGTAFSFDWVNLLPAGNRAWTPPQKVVFAFVDDGSEHRGERIHSTRVPVPEARRVIAIDDPKVLHFQYVHWRRMESKQRWYQCWEATHGTSKRPIQLYRQYHRMDAFSRNEVGEVDERWLREYRECGIDMRDAPDSGLYWWDAEVLDWILQRGAGSLGKLALWDVDWLEVARRHGREVAAQKVRDPRGRFTRAVHRWLRMTQRRDPGAPATRWAQRLLIPFGW